MNHIGRIEEKLSIFSAVRGIISIEKFLINFSRLGVALGVTSFLKLNKDILIEDPSIVLYRYY